MPTTLYVGSDHGGKDLKDHLISHLTELLPHVVDCGPAVLDPDDDYPMIASEVARRVAADPESLGILLCRSGQGVAIVANKYPGIRAAVAWEAPVAVAARHDDKANILCIAADYLTGDQAEDVVRAYLATTYEPTERFERRLHQITEIEEGLQKGRADA